MGHPPTDKIISFVLQFKLKSYVSGSSVQRYWCSYEVLKIKCNKGVSTNTATACPKWDGREKMSGKGDSVYQIKIS